MKGNSLNIEKKSFSGKKNPTFSHYVEFSLHTEWSSKEQRCSSWVSRIGMGGRSPSPIEQYVELEP